MLAIWFLVPLPFLKRAWTSGCSRFTHCWISSISGYKTSPASLGLASPQCVHAQSCPTLCDPMDCSPPGSSVHGIFQTRILEWVAISFSRGLPNPRIKPASPMSPALQVDSLPLSHWGNPESPEAGPENTSFTFGLTVFTALSYRPAWKSFLFELFHGFQNTLCNL